MPFIVRNELTGVRAALKGLDETRRLHLSRLTQSVGKMAQQIYERSQVYVPVDTGKLKESGTWGTDYGPSGTFTKASGVTYHVSYGGETNPVFYAVYVHENTQVYHEPPTGAKFLERAVTEVIALNGGHVPWREGYVGSFGVSATGQGGQENLLASGSE